MIPSTVNGIEYGRARAATKVKAKEKVAAQAYGIACAWHG
jgi:hypothetical protein